MRVASVVLSSVPYAVLGVLLLLMFQADGWDGVGYLLVVLASIPVLLILSVISVVLAFKKTQNLRFDGVSKVLSVISAALFGMGTLGVLLMVILSMT